MACCVVDYKKKPTYIKQYTNVISHYPSEKKLIDLYILYTKLKPSAA